MATRLIEPSQSLLIAIDLQAKLMPAIAGGEAVLANARRLLEAADVLTIPAIVTEQNAAGLGATVEALPICGRAVVTKRLFGACATPDFVSAIDGYGDLVVAGCEAHVCVTQTVLGLLDLNRRVFVVRDAVGSRSAESKETALARLARAGAEIVTAEMVIFEWARSCDHARFKELLRIVK